MEPNHFFISSLPCALWGADSDRVIIAVHGAKSHKKDLPFRLLAETFDNCQVLSFDLPEHGDRQNQPPLCKFPACVQDLSTVFDYAVSRWAHIGLFAVSMGTYFSLLACKDRPVEHAWFLSPVVNMEHLIRNMMIWFQITPEQLERERSIPTPIGQTLYWDDWLYVQAHPIRRWPVPTDILAGERDTLCAPEITAGFAARFSCRLRTDAQAEHWFHTPRDLCVLTGWLRETGADLCPADSHLPH